MIDCVAVISCLNRALGVIITVGGGAKLDAGTEVKSRELRGTDARRNGLGLCELCHRELQASLKYSRQPSTSISHTEQFIRYLASAKLAKQHISTQLIRISAY